MSQHKPSYTSLIREHRQVVRRMELGAAGAIFVEVEADKPAKPRFTYSLVSDDRQSGWYDPGTGVRNDQTGLLMNEEPMSAHRAERLLEELENPEGDL